MPVREESWLARWSGRKLAARRRDEHAQGAEQAGGCAERSAPARAPAPAEPDAAGVEMNEADLAGLGAHSDYRPFLRPGVRAELRSAALRRLWSSEPAFSCPDGLQDYAGDYTDSAAVPPGPVATAYKVGCGFAGLVAGREGGSDETESERMDDGTASEADPERAGNSALHSQPADPSNRREPD